MINRIGNFRPAQPTGERMTLPAGVYEGHIINTRIDEKDGTQTLIIQVEIDKGEYTGFFRKQYESQSGQQYNVRYKGVYRIQLPDGQNEEHDNWRKHQLEGFIWAIEDGNPGYKWNWDETTLKGLKCGLNVRERDYYVNGKFGTTTEIGRIESVSMMAHPDERKRPKPMKRRELSERDKRQMAQDEAKGNSSTNQPSGFVEVTDETLPF